MTGSRASHLWVQAPRGRCPCPPPPPFTAPAPAPHLLLLLVVVENSPCSWSSSSKTTSHHHYPLAQQPPPPPPPPAAAATIHRSARCRCITTMPLLPPTSSSLLANLPWSRKVPTTAHEPSAPSTPPAGARSFSDEDRGSSSSHDSSSRWAVVLCRSRGKGKRPEGRRTGAASCRR